MKRKLQQFLVFKFNSKHIRDNDYNINITVDEARKNNEIISIGESEVIRTLFRIIGREFDRNALFELEKTKRILSKKRRTENNKKRLLEVEEEIQKMLFIPEIVNIQFSNKSHYRKIVKDKLTINGKKYVRLLAGAGNVRTNTVVFIQEEIRSDLINILENGRNKDIELVPAKFNAYIALANSSTLTVSYPRFCIVKDSFISSKREVDYIKTINDPIEEGKIIDIELNSFDGQGLISPRLAKEWSNELGLDYTPASFVVRAPFVKGMVVTFDFHKFSEEVAKSNFITDLYGNVVDVNEIDMILSESQFKMASGYTSTQEYIYKSKQNNLQFGVSRVAPKIDKSYVRSNYQFLQVLDLDDEQIEKLATPTVNWFNDLVGEDPEKMLIYLLGNLTSEKIDRDIFYDLDYITQALILDRNTSKDKYARSRFLNSLTRKMYDSFLGKLIFEGNYSFLISDPYAQCEHVFGLKVKGLLNDGQHYSQFWNKREKKNVVACRPPLTYQSETNILNLQSGNIYDYWYKYINSGIVIPAGGIGIDVVLFADADHDGDIIATFSSKEFLEGVQGGLPISYDKSSATKRKVSGDDDKLSSVDMMSFNSKIGYITNVSSSLYCMLDAYNKNDPEYIEIDKRLKRCRKFQGDAIDAGKGIKIEPFPENFVNYQSVKQNMSDDEIKKIEFENKLVADKRPYFFKYLYRHYGERYKRHYQKFDNYCKIKYGISFEDVMSLDDKTEDQEDVIKKYYDYSYFMFYPSVMNRICWFMEYSIPDVRRRAKEEDFNYFLLFNRNMPVNEEDVVEMEKLYKLYKSHKSSLHKNNNNKNSSFDNLGQFIDFVKNKAYNISNNSRYLANLAVEVCYMRHPKASPEFAWKCFGDGLIENLVQNKRSRDDEIVKVPIKNSFGNIKYLWDSYDLVEYEIDELI